MDKKYTIVTPVKNLIKNGLDTFFIQLLDSIAAQSYPNICHMIIDASSDDGTSLLLNQLENKYKIQIIKIPHPETANWKYTAMNYGLYLAEGDFIQFVQADSFFNSPDMVKTVVEEMEANEADFSYAVCWEMNKTGQRSEKKIYLENFYRSTPFCLDTLVARLDFAQQTANFYPETNWMGQYDYFIALFLSGKKAIEYKKNLLTVRNFGEPNNETPDETDKKIKLIQKEAKETISRIFLGYQGITEQEVQKMVEQAEVPIKFINALLRDIHPLMGKQIVKNFEKYAHRLDPFLEYKKQGFNEICIPLIGIGDALIFSAIAHQLASQKGHKILVGHKHPEIFQNNPDVIATDIVYDSPETLEPRDIKKLEQVGFQILYPTYWNSRPYPNNSEKFFLTYPKQNVIAQMAKRAGLDGQIELKPKLYLTDQEKAFGRFAPSNKKQIAIMSTAISPRKQWPYYQELVDRLKKDPNLYLIQVGAPEDTTLIGVDKNTNGTLTLRETAGILYNSDLFVGQIGSLMHMSRAVDCPAVIAYSSCEPDYMARYIANINVHPRCPCFLSQTGKCDKNCDPCINEHPYCCINTIKVEDMLAAIYEQLKRGKKNLPLETVNVKADPYKNSINEYLRRYNIFFHLKNL